MIKSYIFFTFLAAALVSCGGTKPITTLPDDVEEVTTSPITRGAVDRVLFTSDRQDSIASTISYEFYTQPSRPVEDSVNYFVQRSVSGFLMYGEYTEPNAELSENFIKAALDTLEIMYYEEMSNYEEDEYFGGIWAVDVSNSIDETNSGYVQLSLNSWTYTGGAHGNGWSEDLLLDRESGRVLYLSDFFTDIEALTNLAEPIFRGSQGLEMDASLEEAGYWFEGGVFHLNENFAFTNESIEFFYNTYEIAPYAAGPISLTIPLDQIKHLLKRKID